LTAILSAMAPVYWPATVLPNELLGALLPTGAAGVIGQAALGLVHYGVHVVTASWISLSAYAAISLILLAKVARWRQV